MVIIFACVELVAFGSISDFMIWSIPVLALLLLLPGLVVFTIVFIVLGLIPTLLLFIFLIVTWFVLLPYLLFQMILEKTSLERALMLIGGVLSTVAVLIQYIYK